MIRIKIVGGKHQQWHKIYLVLAKTEKNIEYYLDPKNEKDYLQDLLLNIKEAHVNKKTVTYKIVSPKEKGFVVKVEGLFAYVPFNYLGWSYPTFEFWKNAAKKLVGCHFKGKIHKVTENPINIRINGKVQKFKTPELKNHAKYKSVILMKSKHGFFVDLGLHFNWKSGSLLGLIHKSSLSNEVDYTNWKNGDVITTIFQGFNKKGQIMLGDNLDRGKWMNGEMEKLVGTTQKVDVVINEDGKTEFYVLGDHKAKVPLSKTFYPNYRSEAKKYFYGLKNGATINCEVVRINKRKDSFLLKLLIESIIKP